MSNDPLYKIITTGVEPTDELKSTDKDNWTRMYGQVTKHLIAYRAVTLMPSACPLPAYEGTVRIGIPDGKAVTHSVRIHAEDVYIYVGTRFSFPSKVVTLTARRIIAVAHSTLGSSSITFDLAGDGYRFPGDSHETLTTRANDGGPGKNGDYTDSFWGKPAYTTSTPGGNGDPGKDANAEMADGGSLFIHAELVNRTTVDVAIIANVRGADGENGQSGGNGGLGGSGFSSTTRFGAPFGWHSLQHNILDASNGGNAGAGGRGGQGGKAGTVCFIGSQQTSPRFTAPTNENIAFGKPGKGGSAGDRGGAGAAGEAWVWQPINDDKYNGKSASEGAKADNGHDWDETRKLPEQALQLEDFGHEQLALKAKDPSWKCPPWIYMLLDATHLSMILPRLKFEYQLVYGSQYAYNDGDHFLPTDPTTAGKRDEHDLSGTAFAESCGWFLKRVTLLEANMQPVDESPQEKTVMSALKEQHEKSSDKWIDHASSRKLVKDAFDNFRGVCSAGKGLDLDGEALFCIPDPTLSLAALKATIDDLKVIESGQAYIRAELDNAQKTVETLSVKAESLSTFVGDYTAKVTRIKQDMKTTYELILAKRTSVNEKRRTAVEELDSFWSGLSHQFSCADVTAVMSAVATVLMFAQPEIGALYKVGSALSVGSAASGFASKIKTGRGTEDKDLIGGQILGVGENISSDDLQPAIQAKSQTIASLSGADKEYVNAVAVERKAFNDLVDKRFPRSTSRKARHALDDFLSAAQDLHNAVFRYNQYAVQLYQLSVDKEQKEEQLNILRASPDVSTAFLDLLNTFYSMTAAAQKARAMRMVFNAVRACNGGFLQRSTLLDPLVKLGTFENVSASELEAAFLTNLKADVDIYRHKLGTQTPTPPFGKTLIFSVKNEAWSEMFADFRKVLKVPNPRYDANIPSAEPKELRFHQTDILVDYEGWDSNWYDVRLHEFEVFLPGVVNKNATKDASTKTVGVSVALAGSITVRDENHLDHYFEVDPKGAYVAYNYADPANLVSTTSTPGHEGSVLEKFNFIPDATTYPNAKFEAFSRPMRSPATKYTISIDADTYDIKALKEIKLVLWISVRAPTIQTLFVHAQPAAVTPLARVHPLQPLHHSENHIAIRPMFAGDVSRFRKFLIRVDAVRPMRNRYTPASERADRFIRTSGFRTNYTTYAPFAKSAYGAAIPGKSRADTANAILQNPRDPVIQRFVRNSVANAYATTNALEPAERYTKQFLDAVTDTKGHHAQTSGFQPQENAHRWAQTEEGAHRSFDAWPQKSIVCTPYWAAKIRQADDMIGCINLNVKQIKKETETYFANGGSLKQCYVLLGACSLVAIADVVTWRDGKMTYTMAVAGTTSEHPLAGVNLWVFGAHDDRPGEAFYYNLLIGEHRVRMSDQANSALGPHLMALTWSLAQEYEKADSAGIDRETWLVDNRPELYKAVKLMESADRFLPATVWLQEKLGNNTKAELYVVQPAANADALVVWNGLSAKDIHNGRSTSLVPTKELPGVSIEGFDVVAGDTVNIQDTSATGDSAALVMSDQQKAIIRDKIDNLIRTNGTAAKRKALRKEIETKFAAELAASNLDVKQLPATLFDQLLTATPAGVETEFLLRERLLKGLPSVLGSISNNAAFHGSSISHGELATAVRQVGDRMVVTDMLDYGALCEKWGVNAIQPSVIKGLESTDVDAQLAATVAKEVSDSAAVQALKDKLSHIKPTDPNREAVERQLEAAEQVKEDSVQDREKAQELKDTKNDSGEANDVTREKKISTEEGERFDPRRR